MTRTFELSPADQARHENARQAILNARKLLPNWQGMARMMSRNPRLRVELTSTMSCTNGSTIFIKVPPELGQDLTHDVNLCQKRDETNLPLCNACRILEDVNITVIHEVAHIVFETFEEVTPYEKAQIVQRIIETEVKGNPSSARMQKIKQRVNSAPAEKLKDYLNLSDLVSPFLPFLINACEDVRVNNLMQRDRPGTRKMFDGQLQRVFREGVLAHDGEYKKWNQAPPNAQAVITVFCKMGGYNWREAVSEDVAERLDDPAIDALCEQMKDARTMRDVYRLAFPLLEELRRLGFMLAPEDPEDEPPPQSPEDSADEQEEEEQDDSDSPGEDCQSGDPGESDEDSSDSGGDSESSDGDSEDATEEDGDAGSSSGGGDQDDPGESEPGDDATGEGEGQGAPDQEDDSGASDDGGSDSEDDQGSEAGADPDSSDGDDSDDSSAGDSGTPDDSDAGDTGSDGGDSSSMEAGDSEGDEGGDGEGEPGDQGDSPGTAGTDEAGEAPVEPGSDPSTSDGPPDSHDTGEVAPGQPPDSGPVPSTGDEASGQQTATQDNGKDTDEGKEPYTDEDLERDGTPEEVEHLFRVFGQHEKQSASPSEAVEETLMQEAMELSLKQIDFFDSPSLKIEGVEVHRYDGDPTLAFGSGRHVSKETGEVPDSVVSGSLQRLRLVFQDNKRGKKEPNLKSGKVNTRVLGRRAPIQDPRIFKKTTQPGRKDHFVVIGIDCSGSTSEAYDGYGSPPRLDLMKQAVYAKAEMLSRIGIPFSVYAHSGGRAKVQIFEIKGPKEPWGKNQKAALAALQPYSANLDGHTMEYYRKVAEARTETDRMILYYTDGYMPAANHDEELMILQREIALCKRLGIHLVGIGVNSDSPLEHGLDTILLNCLDDVKVVVKGLQERLA